MKKSMLLSFVTAGAIIATSVGTYAAWDQMDATATGNITMRNPVSIAVESLAQPTETGSIGQLPTYTTTASFTVANAPTTGYQLEPTVTIKNGNDVVTDADITVEVVDDKGTQTDVNGEHTLTLKVTPKDTENAKKLGGVSLAVEVKAELTPTGA